MRHKKPKLTTKEFMDSVVSRRADKGEFYDYSRVEYNGTDVKITIICPIHGEFLQLPRDHRNGHGCRRCASDSYKNTCLEKYGVDNFWKRTDLVQGAMMSKHGVKNPGLMDDHVTKIKTTSMKMYGVEWASMSPDAIKKRKTTNLGKYGVESPMMNPSVSMKMMETKVQKGSFTISNTSSEATEFFREYMKTAGYSINQVAFADSDNGLYEWGYYFDRWYLYDFVAFEEGYRGDPNRILEIVEYHGPFHYTKEESDQRGESKAVPWKNSSTTITESYEHDAQKEKFARTLTDNYHVVWAEKYHIKKETK